MELKLLSEMKSVKAGLIHENALSTEFSKSDCIFYESDLNEELLIDFDRQVQIIKKFIHDKVLYTSKATNIKYYKDIHLYVNKLVDNSDYKRTFIGTITAVCRTMGINLYMWTHEHVSTYETDSCTYIINDGSQSISRLFPRGFIESSTYTTLTIEDFEDYLITNKKDTIYSISSTLFNRIEQREIKWEYICKTEHFDDICDKLKSTKLNYGERLDILTTPCSWDSSLKLLGIPDYTSYHYEYHA